MGIFWGLIITWLFFIYCCHSFLLPLSHQYCYNDKMKNALKGQMGVQLLPRFLRSQSRLRTITQITGQTCVRSGGLNSLNCQNSSPDTATLVAALTAYPGWSAKELLILGRAGMWPFVWNILGSDTVWVLNRLLVTDVVPWSLGRLRST